MFRKISLVLAFVFAAFSLVASPAMATVSYTPEEGGFVGRGDVITALGKNAVEDPTFTYVATVTYEFDCEWDTGPERNRTHHSTTVTVEFSVNSAVEKVVRKNSNGVVTGYRLSAIELEVAAAPTNADCGAEGNGMKTIVDDSIVGPTTSEGGLYVDGVLLQ